MSYIVFRATLDGVLLVMICIARVVVIIIMVVVLLVVVFMRSKYESI